MVSAKAELDPDSIERSIKKTNTIGGALVLSIGAITLTQAIIILDSGPTNVLPFGPGAYGFLKMVAYFGVAASLVAITGGAMAILRRNYFVAVSGGLASVVVGALFIYLVGGFIGLIGLYLMSDREDYKSRPRVDKTIARFDSEE